MCVAGVTFGDIYLHLAWPAWHLLHLAAMNVPCAWQAWHLMTLTFHLRGRRGIWRHLPAFGVAGVALGDIYLRLAWHAWHLLHLHNFHTISFTHNFVTVSFTHHLSHTIFHTLFVGLSFTHNFHTDRLSHTTLSHTSLFVTHHLSHTTLSHTTLHIQQFLLLDPPPPPLSFLPSPSRYNVCHSLLEETGVTMGYFG